MAAQLAATMLVRFGCSNSTSAILVNSHDCNIGKLRDTEVITSLCTLLKTMEGH